MKNFTYTIIIPHKNIPSLLQRCLDSIPLRDDIQIIVVDDNSDSSIVDFKQFPGYNRINTEIYLTKENKGAGYARNVGITYAKGTWIIFADADDFFTPDLLSICDSYKDSIYDMIIFDTCSAFSDSLQETEKREDIIDSYLNKLDENILRYVSHTVWGKMFRRKIISDNHILCDEVAASNDVLFAGLMGLYAKAIKFDNRIGYCCTIRSGSICTKLSLTNISARIFVARKFNSILKTHHIPTKYWMNLVGPLTNLFRVNKKLFIKESIKYFFTTPISRIILDLSESGKRYIDRRFGKNKDKEMRKIQRYQ